ncbi:MAG: hypothetical protein HFJ54_04070 [Clostridia bacterium]|nr:hypothetical protein [Clostridia bacterium]
MRYNKMKNISDFAIKDLKSNKKMTVSIILAIIISVVLINSVITLALSYQEYMINISRSKENWETRFENIQYENINYIESNDNIKEIAIVQNLGISEQSYDGFIPTMIHLKAYDTNAMKNLSINLKKGRLPQKTNEIIITENLELQIGDKLEATINGKNFIFDIVGKIESTEFDEFKEVDYNRTIKIDGAITLCEKENISPKELVNISVISNDISKIYKSIEEIYEKINLKGELSDINILYNDEILSYACVAKEGSDFQKSITIVVRDSNINYYDFSYVINI